MPKKELEILVAEQKILNRIYVVRGQKIMPDEDLAEMYAVETRRLNVQVENLKSQNATSSWGGRRKSPNAFTEQGITMLSGVLNSDVAIEVNTRIIRVFTKLREYAFTHKEILLQLASQTLFTEFPAGNAVIIQ